MCCSPNREAWQTLIYGKECFILLLKYTSHNFYMRNKAFPYYELFFFVLSRWSLETVNKNSAEVGVLPAWCQSHQVVCDLLHWNTAFG